jgi:hypothetical protein
MEALKPVLRISKDAVKAVWGMVTRYAKQILPGANVGVVDAGKDARDEETFINETKGE